jgi:acyl carrier protein
MTREFFLDKLATALELPPGTLSPTTRLDEIAWDSMAELSFISLADGQLGASVSAGAVSDCKTVGDLIKLVEPALDR